MADRVTSVDEGYVAGDLSLFPEAIDDRVVLYQAANNAETVLKQGLPYNADKIIVEDATQFPPQGLLRIGVPPGEPGIAEIVYYGGRTDTVFTNTQRGFVGSRQNQWTAGVPVVNAVMAEPHNAVKDAIINMEAYNGLRTSTDTNTIAGKVRLLEVKHVAPKALFRAFPRFGAPPLNVRFQNFSSGNVIRVLWDFGDGGTSLERSPNHTFYAEGEYTVTLTIVTSTGAQGITTKENYIRVSEEESLVFFYAVQADQSQPAYSADTAADLVETGANPSAVPATFSFVDQSEGEIASRVWVFGDGESETALDPNFHSTTHTYQSPGEYEPGLLLVYADERQLFVPLDYKVIVI
jgi:PKD repeat protein